MTSSRWPKVLLVAGVVLTAFDIALILVLVLTDPPAWLPSLLSLSPWGPIALVVRALLVRHRRMVRRLHEVGVSARGTVMTVGQSGSQLGGRPLLRISLQIEAPGRLSYATMVRNAPPYHLVGTLRPGVSLPVKIDPARRERVLIDWRGVEAETGPR
jgi:hypothetical protein